MQISRHWRLKPQRYRLQGVRYENGDVSLQARPICKDGDCPDVNPHSIKVEPPRFVPLPATQ